LPGVRSGPGNGKTFGTVRSGVGGERLSCQGAASLRSSPINRRDVA